MILVDRSLPAQDVYARLVCNVEFRFIYFQTLEQHSIILYMSSVDYAGNDACHTGIWGHDGGGGCVL